MKEVVFKKGDTWEQILVNGKVIEEDGVINLNNALVELERAGVINLKVEYTE